MTQPTHHKGNTLDLNFTNAPARLNNICVDSTGKFLISDHYPVTADIFSISIHTNTHPLNQPAPLNYLKADLPQLAYHLSLDIKTFTQTLGNSPRVWEDLKYVILNCSECFIPRAIIPSKPSPPWFNSSIRHQLNRTRTLKKRVKKRPTLHMQDKLTTAELILQTAMLEAKENYLSTLVGSFKTQPKKLYGYLNSLNESKYKPQSIVHNNQIVQDPRQKAELFNKFFNSTFTKSNFKLPPVSSLQVPTIQLSSISFTELEVYEALAQLDPQKAMGCDMISPLVLKLCADTLAQPLHNLFSTCIESGTISQEWKIHKICPILKSGNLLEVKNYRPISWLSIVSKVLERIIFNKIIDFLRPKFSKQQFGFQKNKSSLSQLLSSFAYILEEIDKGSTVDMIFLDLKKAFDTVPHEELFFKLRNIGITGPLWYWFKSYLAYGQHFVSVDNNSSTLLPVLSGIPQGSILGPVLFLVYINDLPEQINYASCYLFADDTKLIKSIRGINDSLLMQSDVDSLHRWCEQCKLKLNASKCQTLSVSLSNHHQNHQCQHYSIDGANLDSTNSQRDLGVLVKCDLSWTDHLNQICGRGYRSLNMIRRTIPPGNNHPKEATCESHLTLYISLVRSHLTLYISLVRSHLTLYISLVRSHLTLYISLVRSHLTLYISLVRSHLTLYISLVRSHLTLYISLVRSHLTLYISLVRSHLTLYISLVRSHLTLYISLVRSHLTLYISLVRSHLTLYISLVRSHLTLYISLVRSHLTLYISLVRSHLTLYISLVRSHLTLYISLVRSHLTLYISLVRSHLTLYISLVRSHLTLYISLVRSHLTLYISLVRSHLTLYISLVRSHLTYCSQLWRPRMVKDILSVERVQRKVTKYVLSDYSNDYKLRLQSLHMLPLMYWLELQDIMFLVKCLQDPHDCRNIRSHVSFSPSGTRAGSGNKLKYEYRRTSNGRHFYFNRVVRLWNKLPSSCIDLTKSFTTVRHTVRAFL